LLTGDDLNRAEPSPPPIKLQLEKDNASVTTAGGSATQRIGRLNGEEIRGRDQFPVLSQELLPGCLPAPFWRWLNAMPMENVRDSAASNVVPEVEKGTLDPPITPSAVFFRDPHHQRLDFVGFARPSPVVRVRYRRTSARSVGSAGQQRIRRYDRSHFREYLSSQAFRLGRQPAALLIRENEALWIQSDHFSEPYGIGP
jgi:hypothetical protein